MKVIKPLIAVRSNGSVTHISYYEFMNVGERVTQDEIKTAYKVKAKQYHPDLHGGDKQKENAFKVLTLVFDILKNRRTEYNAMLDMALGRSIAVQRKPTFVFRWDDSGYNSSTDYGTFWGGS